MKRKKKQKLKRRMELYIPYDEREAFDQCLILSNEESMSGLVRRLVKKEHRRLLKKAGQDCPE